MFRLTEEEIPERLKSQFATLNENGNRRGLHIIKLPERRCKQRRFQ